MNDGIPRYTAMSNRLVSTESIKTAVNFTLIYFSVHFYGRFSDDPYSMSIAKRNGLVVMCDILLSEYGDIIPRCYQTAVL